MVFTHLNFLRLLKNNGETEEEPESNAKKKATESQNALYQIFINLGPLMITASVGAMMGFSGIFLPQLEAGNTRFENYDTDIGSWIASSAVLPICVCAPLGGYLMEILGRKWAQILSSIPAIIGWIIIAYSPDITTMLIGRVLTGITCGIIAPINPAYIGETAAPPLRPLISGGISLNLNLGTFLCHLVGTFFSWETTAIFCLFIPLTGSLLACFSQETPTWLISKNKVDQACTNFKKIRGDSEENRKELGIILERHKNKHDIPEVSLWDTMRSLRSRPEIFKPIIILVVYFVCAQFAGINVVTFYAIYIVERSLGPNFKNPYLIMLSMDFVRMASSILACVLLKRLPRRQMAIVGGAACFITLITLSASSYLADFYPDSQILVYISLAALFAYVFFISMCLVPLPWCLAGELLPQEVKGLASGILFFIAFSALFIAIKCSPLSFYSLGMHGTYLIFGTFALIGTLLCYFCLHETKNKTLNDIADLYRKKKGGNV